MRWALTFAFPLTDEEIGTLTPIIEAQDLALLRTIATTICFAHDFGPDKFIIVDMWQRGDDTEMETI